MTILFVGIDLAKNVFAVHGVDGHGKAVLIRPSVQRSKLHELVASLPVCTIGMEACSGAHHWARLFKQHGHTVRLMAPKFVSPYRMSGVRGKNDAADAAAICEAVQRPNMLWRVNLDARGATIWMRTVSRRVDDAAHLIVVGGDSRWRLVVARFARSTLAKSSCSRTCLHE